MSEQIATDTETSDLYQQSQKLKPKYGNHSEALVSIHA